jgi:prepilin-type N-terminal cleavage/methylation domain-containing protein
MKIPELDLRNPAGRREVVSQPGSGIPPAGEESRVIELIVMSPKHPSYFVLGGWERPIMRIHHARKAGFTLVEIMIVVAIIGLLAAIALPSWHRARENAQLKSIANNLRMLEAAKSQWALEGKKGTTEPVTTSQLTDYLKNNTIVPVVQETYAVGGGGTVGDLVQAQISGTLLDQSGPFTITNF